MAPTYSIFGKGTKTSTTKDAHFQQQWVCQHSIEVIQAIRCIKTDTSKNDVCKNNRSQRCGQKSYISYTSADPVCAICDSPDATNDHVSTSGPGGSRIIQYYSCKKFAELSPANRLSLLKSKDCASNACFQLPMLHLVDTKKGNANTTSLVNMNLIKGIPFESMCSFAKNTKIHKPTKIFLNDSSKGSLPEVQVFQALRETSAFPSILPSAMYRKLQLMEMEIQSTTKAYSYCRLSTSTEIISQYFTTMVAAILL